MTCFTIKQGFFGASASSYDAGGPRLGRGSRRPAILEVEAVSMGTGPKGFWTKPRETTAFILFPMFRASWRRSGKASTLPIPGLPRLPSTRRDASQNHPGSPGRQHVDAQEGPRRFAENHLTSFRTEPRSRSGSPQRRPRSGYTAV